MRLLTTIKVLSLINDLVLFFNPNVRLLTCCQLQRTWLLTWWSVLMPRILTLKQRRGRPLHLPKQSCNRGSVGLQIFHICSSFELYTPKLSKRWQSTVWPPSPPNFFRLKKAVLGPRPTVPPVGLASWWNIAIIDNECYTFHNCDVTLWMWLWSVRCNLYKVIVPTYVVPKKVLFKLSSR